MIDRQLLEEATDQEGLVRLLGSGLGWPVDSEFAFEEVPEIAAGVKSNGAVRVSRLIPASLDQDRLILLAEFAKPYVRRDLRELLISLRRLVGSSGKFPDLTGVGDTLFIVAAPDYEDVRFIIFEERDRRLPRIRSFGWQRDYVGRTLLTHNLPRLRWGNRAQWEAAWDVEGLTTEFFGEYRAAFDKAEKRIRAANPEQNRDWRLFTQRLFNRLLFIQFLSRKGWLEFEGSRDYLTALYRRCRADGSNFYRAHLYWVFFAGLGRDRQGNEAVLRPRRGIVPYLNGGLFEMADETDSQFMPVEIPHEVFQEVIEGLFSRWNFTVTENTPLDVDVAVDPEMLGMVFEELVTGRHESGSYYTPRSVVAFMCREALKGYLTTDGADPELVAALVDRYEADAIPRGVAKALLDRLLAIRVVDPACGSGAYLLGMLHELFVLIGKLEVRVEELTPRDEYHRKLAVIQRCIYGVDVDEFAVNIARLRLWLSLAVEFQGDTPEPLPNLDFKIERGDSLLAPDPSGGSAPDMFRWKLIQEFQRKKADYADPYHGGSKAARRRDIEALRLEISEGRESGGKAVNGFDWAVDFVEVFPGGNGGFDVVLANPPYVRADAQFKHLLPDKAAQAAAIRQWKAYRQDLKQSGTYETLHEKWDLYIPFLERAHQLLAVGGQMVFIIPDAYNANKYAERSHAFFLEKASVERLDFCSEIPLFDAGVYNTILHFARRPAAEEHAPVRVRRWGESPADFDANAEVLLAGTQTDLGERLFRPAPEANAPSFAGCVPLAQACYVSKGAVLHADERKAHGAFRLDDLISERPDAQHPKRLFLGRDMGTWTVLKYSWLEYGTARAPSLFSRPTFPELYEVPEKLVSMDLSGSSLRVVLDDAQCWHNHSAWSFVLWHHLQGIRNNSIRKAARYANEANGSPTIGVHREELEDLSKRFDIAYLQGILNSTFARRWMSRQRRSKLHVYPDDWKQFPVKDLAPVEQAPIASRVRAILAAKRADPDSDVSDLEAEIDARVEFLYFHAHEAPTFDEWVAKKEAEKGTAIEAIRNLIAGGESGSVEFKQSLEYVDPAGFSNVPENQRAQKIVETRKAVVHSALKTICAFLNSKGGTLLLGVHDSGDIIGIEPDYTLCGRKPNRDGFELKLTDFYRTRFSPLPTALDTRFVDIDGKTVCRIDAPRSSLPTYLDNKLYVRLGNSTEELTGRHLQDWLQQREAAK